MFFSKVLFQVFEYAKRMNEEGVRNMPYNVVTARTQGSLGERE